jgi:hypothetical protein
MISQVKQDHRLSVMWNQGILCAVIAKELGYNHASSVRHAAKRLGLAKRAGNRDTRAATEASVRMYREGKRDLTAARLANAKHNEAAQEANRLKNRLKRAESRRRVKAGMSARQQNPTPTMWRCQGCGQISLDGERHKHCEAA